MMFRKRVYAQSTPRARETGITSPKRSHERGCALRLRLGPHGSTLAWGRANRPEGTSMDRRTLLLGLLGGLVAAPTIIAAASSVEAAPLPEVRPPTPEPVPGHRQTRKPG